ncbi:PVC-type heme-binding CxxCH protein [Eudoraea chungangensis]|uniref:PVC-type heme-binding CxxCH protein n=1 Tax=Eudoraea chungangensis TaxID=1481905 RepID=UPI0023EAE483|nr:PVC-type heme-binding CxxCH protein [Eudoraea chungangensis]
MKKSILFFLAVLLLFACMRKEDNDGNSFQLHPDFKMDLVASEPLVFDPVELQFSPSGEAFVLEMPGYPLRDATSRIVHLKDNNQDGIFDERKMFAEDLGVASSFMFYKGGFLVAAPPHLLWIGDEDNDGLAEKRIVLMDGFSNENLQHNFNGLTYGLDNWIYAANGGNSGAPFFTSTPNEFMPLRGGDLRFNLEDEVLERVGESSGGFKITFDNWGRLYETHNLEHVSQLVFEDRYFTDMPSASGHALVNISDHEENGLSRIYPIGEQDSRVNHPEQSGYFSGACGITYYGGGIFPEDMDNSLLVADCVLNLVHMDQLDQEFSVSKATRNREKIEFLASSDRSFRPVNMSIGPDGALYVLDMHREVIEHPEWIPDEIEINLDLNAGKDKGRIYRISPKTYTYTVPINFEKSEMEDLVSALGDDNQWIRRTAQQLLVSGKRLDAKSILEKQLSNPRPLARLHSLWTLEGLGELEDEYLLMALEDDHPGVTESAVRIAEKRLHNSSALVDSLIHLLPSADKRVRLQITLSLSTLENNEYGRVKEVIAKEYQKILEDEMLDYWNLQAISFVLKPQALEILKNEIIVQEDDLGKQQKEMLNLLIKVVGKDYSHLDIADILDRLGNSTLSPKDKAILITSLSDGYAYRSTSTLNPSEELHLLRSLNSLETNNDIEIIKSCGELRLALGVEASKKVNEYLPLARKNILEEKGSVEEQLAQLQLIGLADFEFRSELLYALLETNRPLILQREALSQLWNSNKEEVGPKLLHLWPSLGPEARRHATDILLYKSFNHDPLLTAMENGEVNLGEFNLDLERRRVLLFSEDAAIRKRAEALFSDSGIVQRKEAIDQMLPALQMEGTASRGKAVFRNQCASCHIYDDIGNQVGPVLTEISRKSKESLLHEILDPNAAVDTKYLNYKVVTKDGNIYFGLVSSETDSDLTLAIAGGKYVNIQKINIENFSTTGKSLMPEGLEFAMDKQEMADLLAYLQEGIPSLK